MALSHPIFRRVRRDSVSDLARRRATHGVHRPYFAPKKRWVKVAMKLISISNPAIASAVEGGVLWLIGALEAVLVLGAEAARTFFATRAQSRRDYPYGEERVT